MNIILEGPDNAGKSTLANAISIATGWEIYPKEGRPSNWFLMLEKIRNYEVLDHLIIDRHPIISQSIYGQIVRKDPPIPQQLVDNFRTRNDLIIYCRCIARGLADHEASPTDTDQHLSAIQENYDEVLAAYDSWAIQHANIFYTDYKQLPRVAAMVRGVVCWNIGGPAL